MNPKTDKATKLESVTATEDSARDTELVLKVLRVRSRVVSGVRTGGVRECSAWVTKCLQDE